MNWQLALFILLLNPLVIYVTTLFGRKVKQLKRAENRAYQAFQESLAETLEAIQQIRAANRERHYVRRLIDNAGDIRRHAGTFAWKSDAANRLSFVVFLFGFDVFRTLSFFMVLYSDLSIGEMLAVFAYLWFMMGPVQEVLSVQYAYHSAQAALGRINELLGAGLEPRYPHLRDPFAGRRTVPIRLEDVCFAYGDGPLVLDHVSLEIAAGEKVAIVGASGGGKTTLVQILLGLYAPRSGQVYYDERPGHRDRAGRRPRQRRHRAAAPCPAERHGADEPHARPRRAGRSAVAGARDRPAGRHGARAGRTAWTRSSAATACACRAGSGSASRSHAWC